MKAPDSVPKFGLAVLLSAAPDSSDLFDGVRGISRSSSSPGTPMKEAEVVPYPLVDLDGEVCESRVLLASYPLCNLESELSEGIAVTVGGATTKAALPVSAFNSATSGICSYALGLMPSYPIQVGIDEEGEEQETMEEAHAMQV